MAADNIISLGFNYDELTAEQKKVIDLLDQVFDKTKQLNGIQMNPSTDGLAAFSANLQQQRDAIAALTSLYPPLTQAQRDSNEAQKAAAELAIKQAKALQAQADAAKKAADATTAQVRAKKAEEDQSRRNETQNNRNATSTAKMTNEYLLLRAAYEKAALEAKRLQTVQATNPSVAGAAAAQAMTDRAVILHSQLTLIEQSVGQYNRNVGNYASALTGYANTLRGLRGPVKLLGEALGVGAQEADQMRIVLEHSIQGIAAFFRGKEASAAAAAADTAALGSNTLAARANTAATAGMSAMTEEAMAAEIAAAGGLKAYNAGLVATAIATESAAAASGIAAASMGTMGAMMEAVLANEIAAAGGIVAYNAALDAQAAATAAAAAATTAGGRAMALFNASMKWTGIGLALAALGFLVYKIIEYRKEMVEAVKYSKMLNDLNEDSAKNAGAESARLKITKSDLESENVSRKTKIQLIKDLKEEYPTIFDQYTTEEILLGKVANAYDLAAEAILRKAKAEAASKQITDIATKQLDIELKAQQDAAQTNLNIKNAHDDNSISSGGTGGAGGNFGGASKAANQKAIKEDYDKRQAARQKEYDDLEKQNQFYIKFAVDGANETTKIDKDKKEKKVKSEKDASFEILENARKTSFELRQLRDKDVLEGLKLQSENNDNGTDDRIDALLQMGLKEQQIIVDQANFEKNAVARKLEFELTTEKHNQNEIVALRAKAVGDIAILDQKQSDESIKEGRSVVDAIKKLEDEAAKSTQKTYDETQKAAMSELERKARLMEKDEKDKEKKPKEAKVDESVKDGEIDVAKVAQDTIFSFIDDRYEKEKNLIQEKINLIQKANEAEISAINRSTMSAQEKAAQITIAEKTAASQTEALKKKQKEDDIKKAKWDKAQAAMEIIENTAIAVMAALKLPVIGEARAIEIGAIGALQLAAVLAKPIPAYAKGTENHKGGLAIFGEAGPEMILEPNKKPYIATTATLANLPINTKVRPLLDSAVNNLGNSAISNQFMNMARLNNMMDIKVQMGEERMIKGIVNGLMQGLNNVESAVKKKQPINVRPIIDNSAFYAYKDSQTKR